MSKNHWLGSNRLRVDELSQHVSRDTAWSRVKGSATGVGALSGNRFRRVEVRVMAALLTRLIRVFARIRSAAVTKFYEHTGIHHHTA